MSLAQEVLPSRVLQLYDPSQLFLHQTGVERVALVGALGLAAPVCEEFFFRGVLQPGLMSRLEPARAIVVTALLFSAFHLDPVGFLARFELGILFGLLAWRSGSVWPGIAAHAANNLTATALYFLAPGEAEPQAPLLVVGGMLLGGNLGLLLLARAASGRLRSPKPAEEVHRPVVPLWRGSLGVAVPALASLGVFLAVDWRGAVLRSSEAMHPLPPGVVAPSELEALRARARRGEVPISDYLEARSLLGPTDTPPSEK
jgi:hypothetical protein